MTFNKPDPMEGTMLLAKIGERRQVHIPKPIFEEMELKAGEFLEVFRLSDDELVFKKKKIVDVSKETEAKRGALPPVLPYEERMKILESMYQGATDDSEDIDLDFIKKSRTSKEITISFDE
jgi:AbrB family looped-hinge helix DNA binding protein